jgi:hypothetical protein
MNKELQDKIRVIAEYDGYTVYDKRYPRNHGIGGGDVWNVRKDIILQKCKYLTSLDWLHPVAMKVIDDGEKIENPFMWEEHIQPIYRACWQKHVNGEYIDLFNAVYDAIMFLKQVKEKV